MGKDNKKEVTEQKENDNKKKIEESEKSQTNNKKNSKTGNSNNNKNNNDKKNTNKNSNSNVKQESKKNNSNNNGKNVKQENKNEKKQENNKKVEAKSKNSDKKEEKNIDNKENKKNKDKKKNKKKGKKQKLTKAERKERRGNFREKISLKFRKKLIANRFRTWLLVLVLIALFIIINVWANSQATAQIDVTENKIYTLSQTSKDQLESLDKEVMIYVYGYDDSDTYVEFVKQYVAFNDNIQYEIVTTETNYEIITEYDLDDYDYSAFVIVCGDKDYVLYPDYEFYSYDYVDGSYTYADTTEECITNAIINVSSDDPIKVYFVTGHGEFTTSYMSYLLDDLESLVYECEELNLLTVTEVPEDCDVLAIISPESDISADEAEVLKSYINNGGNMLVSLYKEDYETDYTNFESVLDLYGVEVEYGLLYEGSSSYSYSYGGYSYPYMLIVNASSSSDITSDLSTSGYYPILPYSQNIIISDVEEENVEVSSTELLYTSDYCYNITDPDMINQGLSLDGLEQASYAVSAKFTRTITISDESEEETDETTDETEETEEEETTIESNLVIIGNSYIFLDDYGYYSYTGNRTFITNAFADLAEQDNLLTIKKYESSSSTFDKTATTASYIVVRTIVFGLPIFIILIGIVIWAVRRRKR